MIVSREQAPPLVGHSVSDANGFLLAMDPAICEILQRSQHELRGMAYTDLTHPDDLVRNVELVDRLGIVQGPLTIRKRYVRPDGTAVWADVQVSRLDGGRDDGRLVGTIRLVVPTAIDRGPESLWRSALRIDALIRRRRDELGDDLFSDHAWIILLQLYLAEAEGRVVDAAAIADRAAIRPAMVMRWLRALEQKGLADRPAWLAEASQLTAAGIAKVERLLASSLDD